MYEKKIKIKGKDYIYYYHNFKINGKVKNICLGNNKEDSSKKLEELMSLNFKSKLMDINTKNINFIKDTRTFMIMLFAFIGIGALYYIKPEITGSIVYSNNVFDVLKIKELLGILISLELMFFGYFIYKDSRKNKLKVI